MEKLSDREKLALAFDDLAQLGYFAPVDFAWKICCQSCGLEQVSETLEIRDEEDLEETKYCFWHEQKDQLAFYGDLGYPLPKRFEDCLPEDDELAWEHWYEEHAAELEAAELDERLTKYNVLRNDLWLHWGGNATEIVDILRSRGLRAILPESYEECIRICAHRRPNRCDRHRQIRTTV